MLSELGRHYYLEGRCWSSKIGSSSDPMHLDGPQVTNSLQKCCSPSIVFDYTDSSQNFIHRSHPRICVHYGPPAEPPNKLSKLYLMDMRNNYEQVYHKYMMEKARPVVKTFVASTRRKVHFKIATRVPLHWSSLYKCATQYEKTILAKIINVPSIEIKLSFFWTHVSENWRNGDWYPTSELKLITSTQIFKSLPTYSSFHIWRFKISEEIVNLHKLHASRHVTLSAVGSG